MCWWNRLQKLFYLGYQFTYFTLFYFQSMFYLWNSIDLLKCKYVVDYNFLSYALNTWIPFLWTPERQYVSKIILASAFFSSPHFKLITARYKALLDKMTCNYVVSAHRLHFIYGLYLGTWKVINSIYSSI